MGAVSQKTQKTTKPAFMVSDLDFLLRVILQSGSFALYCAFHGLPCTITLLDRPLGTIYLEFRYDSEDIWLFTGGYFRGYQD